MNRLITIFVMILCIVGYSNEGHIQLNVESAHAQGSLMDAETIKKVLEFNRENENLINKAISYLRDSKVNAALQTFKEAIHVAPYDHRAYVFLATLFIQMKNDSDAFQILEKARRYASDSDLIFQLISQLEPEWWNSENAEDTPNPKDKSKPIVSIAQFRDNKQCAISFNFDDGAKSVYTKALPIFDLFGYKATIPVNTGSTFEEERNPWWGTWGEWRDAHQRGFEIANHTVNHQPLEGISDESLDYEVNTSYDIIEEKIGSPPLSFIFPGEITSPKIIEKAKERHIAMRDHEILAELYDKLFILIYGGRRFSVATARNIVDLAIRKRLWLIPECHAIKEEKIKTYKPLTEDFLMAHLFYINKNEDKIWVDTFLNVHRYLTQRKSAEIDISELTQNTLTFKLTSPLDSKKYPLPLTIIIDVFPKLPEFALAAERGTSIKPHPVKIEGSKLYVNIAPGADPIHVKWSNKKSEESL